MVSAVKLQTQVHPPASYLQISCRSRISRLGGRRPIRGGADLQRGRFLVETCAKTKEFGPVGEEGLPAHPLDPPLQIVRSNTSQTTRQLPLL